METNKRRRFWWLTARVPTPIIVVLGVFFAVFGIMSYLGARESGRFDRTRRQLWSFSNALEFLVALEERKRIPGPNLEDAVNAVRSNKASFERMDSCPLILDGYDAWGTKWIYTIDSTGRRATITSAGPNGRYDGGDVDDLSVSVVSNP